MNHGARKRNTTLAAIAYLVFFVPLFGNEKKDPFVQFHVRQGVGLLIVALALQGVLSILGYWGVGPRAFLLWPVRLFLLFEVFQGMVRASRGETEELPYIGKYASRLYDLQK
jgi:uncharacterized membrane protein